MAGSLVAKFVLSKSLLRSQGGLTDVYVRVLGIEAESSLIRNLNHVNAVHDATSSRTSPVNPIAPVRPTTRLRQPSPLPHSDRDRPPVPPRAPGRRAAGACAGPVTKAASGYISTGQ